MNLQELKTEYRSSLKSSDTEEHIDLAFYRPLGFAWACLFRKLGVTPNVVTILSIFLGIGAGVCFYYDSFWINLLGVLLLVWANTYDSCDGQLARLTGQYSPIGRVLDGMAGDLWFLTIYIAICLRCVDTVSFFADHNWAIWLLGSLAGVSHLTQAGVADYYRQFHLNILKGGFNKELASAADLREKYLADHGASRVIGWLYWKYTCVQEGIAPNAVAARRMLAAKYPRGIPADEIARLRALSAPLCKYENFLTFNWRSLVLFASVLSGFSWAYFAIELTVFNAVLIHLICSHERMCAQILKAGR